jgi:hypothetical protein
VHSDSDKAALTELYEKYMSPGHRFFVAANYADLTSDWYPVMYSQKRWRWVKSAQVPTHWDKTWGLLVVDDTSTVISTEEAQGEEVYAGATEPADKTQGTLWYDTTDDVVKLYDGSAWIVWLRINEASDCAASIPGEVAFASTDATPSVKGGTSFKTANASATTITGFDDGVAGQVITVRCADSNTTIDSGLTSIGASIALSSGDVLQFVYDGSAWQQVSGSVGMPVVDSVVTLAVNDATPTVSGVSSAKTANTSSTTITDFDDGAEGQMLTLLCADANTTIDGGLTATGMTIPLVAGDTLTWVYDGSSWQQIAGSVGMGRFVPITADEVGDWIASTVTTATDVDVSDDGVRAGAVAVLLHVYLLDNSGVCQTLYMRKNGSSETGFGVITNGAGLSAERKYYETTVKLDDDAVFEAWFNSSWSTTQNQAWVNGYYI